MKEYKFLVKPVFYIFSLLFATWLVIKIEKISPSDCGYDTTDVIQKPNHPELFLDNKKYLENLCIAFKTGTIDSAELNKKLTFFLESTKTGSPE